MKKMLPLEGVRIIEVGQALAAPLAATIMADMGADVIKVEKPDGGDDARLWGPPFGPDGKTSLYFHGQNRNKRSIVLDIKRPEDIKTLHRLCETADILIQNLRLGIVERCGISAEVMCARHPRLVYCNISSFGQTGPMCNRPAFDPLMQAYGGMMTMTGRPSEEPNLCGASINDKATGLFSVIGVLAALRKRDVTGVGGIVDTSLLETAVHWVETPLNAYFATGEIPMRHGTGGAMIVPYQAFYASDVAFVIAAGNDRMFASCATVLGHPEWATDTRFAAAAQRVVHKKALITEMRKVILTQTRDFWIDKLTAADVPCAPIHDLGELAKADQFIHMDMTQILPNSGVKVVGLPISFDRERPRSARSSPELGEHTEEILAEIDSRRSK